MSGTNDETRALDATVDDELQVNERPVELRTMQKLIDLLPVQEPSPGLADETVRRVLSENQAKR